MSHFFLLRDAFKHRARHHVKSSSWLVCWELAAASALIVNSTSPQWLDDAGLRLIFFFYHLISGYHDIYFHMWVPSLKMWHLVYCTLVSEWKRASQSPEARTTHLFIPASVPQNPQHPKQVTFRGHKARKHSEVLILAKKKKIEGL